MTETGTLLPRVEHWTAASVFTALRRIQAHLEKQDRTVIENNQRLGALYVAADRIPDPAQRGARRAALEHLGTRQVRLQNDVLAFRRRWRGMIETVRQWLGRFRVNLPSDLGVIDPLSLTVEIGIVAAIVAVAGLIWAIGLRNAAMSKAVGAAAGVLNDPALSPAQKAALLRQFGKNVDSANPNEWADLARSLVPLAAIVAAIILLPPLLRRRKGATT